MAVNSVDGRGVQVDVRELFSLLESNQLKTVDEITEEIQQHLSSVKEAWLMNSLVDYYYIAQTDRVIDILTSVREPHDKHLVEKLTDGLKSEKHQLLAMKLLLHVVCKQPMWVHKLIKPPIFPALIKCLKTDTDIPLLMTGVMVITILLPAIPSLVGKHLPDIFDIFGHLINFNVKKPSSPKEGNVPDIFLLHLQVALYGLFHRLYGMFPYTFLTFLRHQYSKKENATVYEEAIKPMLERVRLHPHLINGTREKEMDAKRWKSLEDHDVIVQCAKMSLDQIEGTWEEMSCPVASSPYKAALTAEDRSRRKSSVDGRKPRSSVSSPPQLSPNVTSQDLASIWSPSLSVGLSTPPPSQRTTPATSVLESSLTSLYQAQQGTSANTSTTATPRATPPISAEEEKSKGRLKAHREMKKLSLSSKSLPGSVEGKTSSSSVPPSPLRAEFTTEPPRGIFKSLPVKQAARELQFDVGSARRNMNTPEQVSENIQDSPLPGEGLLKDIEADRSDLMESYSRDAIMKTQAIEEDTDDQEVSDLTKNPVPPMFQTAESVAKFMRSVNRIRFNSMTNEVESILAQEKHSSKKSFSRSCPNLHKMPVTEEEADDHLSRSVSTTFRQSSESDQSKVSEVKDIRARRTSTPSAVPDTSKSTNVTINLSSHVVNNITYQRKDSLGKEKDSDLMSVLKSVLVPAKVAVCQRCSVQCLTTGSPSKSDEDLPTPIFETYSPPELLDRHLQLGGNIHAKQLSRIPLTNQDSINWTHFGGMPPADEVNILRGQIIMMKNQILYERNKRELHAKRNRRLLRKITTANALEEQTKAQKEQIKILETEIQNLRLSMKILQEENRRLKQTNESNEYETQVKLRACLNELDELRLAKTEMNTLLIKQREDQDALKAKLQSTEAQLFQEQRVNQHLKEQVQMTQRLKEQVLQLHKELLLMGELQGKYETKLSVIRNSHHAKPEQETMIGTLRAENTALREKMKSNTLNLEGFGKRVQELEGNVQNKQMTIEELQRQLHYAKICQQDEIKAVEDKYSSICSINQRLEGHIMSLYAQIDQLQQPKQAKIAIPQPPNVSDDSAPRERTGSVPTKPPSVKPPLTKMSSVPLGCGLAGPPPTGVRTGQEASKSPHSDTGKYRSDVTRAQLSGRTERSEDTASVSSTESMSSSGVRRGNILHSDGEEKSQSSKDSGYNK
ncbi:hamartin-like isoform X1 [Saccostrea echinata]|uniref:hamartin-like isoform X1 n=1 Tax=Saccostrea echinata TaxID=191078 RepID=UPI002A83198A|nr:hamartin-like isoform X1 [Saccostrea echinata]